jgi:hypothetical protein
LVANCYGLSKEQYTIVLESFDRASGKNIYKDNCLEKYAELIKIGTEAYIKNYDPYWDVPLNENLPEPVIEIPIISKNKDKLNLF